MIMKRFGAFAALTAFTAFLSLAVFLPLSASVAEADIFYAASNYSTGSVGTVTGQGSALTVHKNQYVNLNGDAAGFSFKDHEGRTRLLTRERFSGRDDTVRVFDPSDFSRPILNVNSWGAANIHSAASMGQYLYLTTYESYAPNSPVENTGEVVRVDMADGYTADMSYNYERQNRQGQTYNPHGEGLYAEGGYLYALFGLSTGQAIDYAPSEIVKFDADLNIVGKVALDDGAHQGQNALRMAYYGGKLYVTCVGGYQGPNSWGDIWEVDISGDEMAAPRRILDGHDMTYQSGGENVAIGMYSIQFSPDGAAYILTGSYSQAYDFRGRLYVTTAANLANGNPGSLRQEYSEASAGFSWDLVYDNGSGVLWCMVGKWLEARDADGVLVRRFTPGELGDNIYSISEIFRDEGLPQDPQDPSGGGEASGGEGGGGCSSGTPAAALLSAFLASFAYAALKSPKMAGFLPRAGGKCRRGGRG